MQFVDTNIFLRFLTKDDPKKAEKCLALFESANKKEIKLQTTESVITEIVYILSSKRLYNLSRLEVYEKLVPILKMRGLKIPNKRTLITALIIYSEYTVDFEDAVLVANTLKTESREIYSYDRGFNKISEIKRLEP